MKRLYISDLDGTLLGPDQKLSSYTIQTMNRLIQEGMQFGIATARSYQTAMAVIGALDVNIPLILHNGTMICEKDTHRILMKNTFDQTMIREMIGELLGASLYPVVYAFIDGRERFSFLPDHISDVTHRFLKTRSNDPRCREVHEIADMLQGDIYYVMVIDEPARLKPFASRYQACCHVIYARDFYTGDQWLELMPEAASKANAIRQLKAYLNCDEVVVFGDHYNDIDMFQAADYAVAVADAVDDLKAYADEVIDQYPQDGVARWLEAHFSQKKDSYKELDWSG